MKKLLILLIIVTFLFSLSSTSNAEKSFSISADSRSQKAKQAKVSSISFRISENSAGTLSAAAVETNISTVQFSAFDTDVTIAAYGPNHIEALTSAEAEVKRLDALFDPSFPMGNDLVEDRRNSIAHEIAYLNYYGSNIVTAVSKDTWDIISRAVEINEMTDHVFSITLTPLRDLWGFTTSCYHVPTKYERIAVLDHSGMGQVHLGTGLRRIPGENGFTEAFVVRLTDGCTIDLSNIAKGFTVARVMDILKEYGVTGGSISLGNCFQSLNTRPDGREYRIVLGGSEASEDDSPAVLIIGEKCVKTFGGDEAYFTADAGGKITTDGSGSIYTDILDPRTGLTVNNNLASVSIVSNDAVLSDALSTALFIMGYDSAVRYWRESPDLFEAIFLMDDGSICATAGLEGCLSVRDDLVDISFVY